MRNIATIIVALLLAGGTALAVGDPIEPPSKTKIEFGGQNVLYRSVNRIVFVPGDSLDARNTIERERLLREQREKEAQSKKGSSYTGTGQDIEIVGQSWEQCVIYFKRVTGISRSLGYAGNIPAQGQEAKIGSGALEYNHISLVIADYGDSVRVRESNYWRGYVTERTVSKNQIRGYLYF